MSSMHTPVPDGPQMKKVTIRVPEPQIEDLEARVDEGEFPNRSEAVRTAVREMLYEDGGRR